MKNKNKKRGVFHCVFFFCLRHTKWTYASDAFYLRYYYAHLFQYWMHINSKPNQNNICHQFFFHEFHLNRLIDM